MIVVGFDVSVTRIGFGVVQLDVDERGTAWIREMHCAARHVRLSTTGWRHDGILQTAQEAMLRLRLGRPDAVYIEKPALPRASGTDSAFNAGRALQAVRCAVQIAGWPDPELLQPSEWKHAAGVDLRKGATLSEMREQASPRPVPADRDAKPDVYLRALDLGFAPEGSQDAADAALVAVAGAIIRHTKNRQEDTL